MVTATDLKLSDINYPSIQVQRLNVDVQGGGTQAALHFRTVPT